VAAPRSSEDRAREAYEDIAEELAERGVESSKMFGMPTLKAEGHAFAGLYRASMVFKLPPDPHKEAMTLRGSRPFDPSGMGRPMKEWVVVTESHESRWPAFAERARAYVAGHADPKKLTAKKAAPKKPASKKAAAKKPASKKPAAKKPAARKRSTKG
jgi:hypothetical protein